MLILQVLIRLSLFIVSLFLLPKLKTKFFFKGSDISGIVVAEIKSVENHPDSKKLHLLKVDAGDGQLTDVVCGAPNVRVGLKNSFCKSWCKDR